MGSRCPRPTHRPRNIQRVLRTLSQSPVSMPQLSTCPNLAPTDVSKLALLNIRSLSSKTVYINDLIVQQKLDLLILTECWLSTTAQTVLIEASPPDYNFLFSARQERKGGGIAAFLSDCFDFTERKFGDVSTFEYLAFTVKAQQHILVLSI